MLSAASLGSNIGNRHATLLSAVRALAGLQPMGAPPPRCSSIYETTPVDCPPGSPGFLNMVVVIDYKNDDPLNLLADLQGIEREHGRVRPSPRNAPRTLDLDILLVGGGTLSRPGLVVPHPELARRAFVLVPLAEIAPDWRVPPRNVAVPSLLAALAPDDVATVVKVAEPPRPPFLAHIS